jgi:ubiquinone biosynthesis protein COQ9
MTETSAMPDFTLDEMRAALAPLVAANAVFDGWGPRALADAAATLGVPVESARLAFEGGEAGMIDAWFESVDLEMARRLPVETLAAMKIRERIRALVLARLDILRPQREAVRRALARLALPGNLVRAARIGWRSADAMWRQAGDTAVDFNHYTKRTTLGAIYASTLMVWLNDQSEGEADTAAFLDRRIEDVMRFEKAKAKFKPQSGMHFSPARLLARLRYPEAN